MTILGNTLKECLCAEPNTSPPPDRNTPLSRTKASTRAATQPQARLESLDHRPATRCASVTSPNKQKLKRYCDLPNGGDAADWDWLVQLLASLLVAPNSVRVDAAVLVRRLVGPELVHPVGDKLLIVNHDIHLLRVSPRLSVLVAVSDDGHLVVERGVLDCNGQFRTKSAPERWSQQVAECAYRGSCDSCEPR